MKVLFLTLALVGTNLLALEKNEKFTLLCEESVVNGLNWSNGDWHPTKFQENKYIIKRHSVNPDATWELPCLGEGYDKVDTTYGDQHSIKSCYSISKFGEKPNIFDNATCEEIWNKAKNGKFEHWRTVCKGMGSFRGVSWAFKAHGWFHRSIMHYNLIDKPPGFKSEAYPSLNSPADQKDSMFVSAGKCSVI